MLFITCKREKILDFFSLREKEDLIDLLRDMVSEIGLDCNSTELNDLYSELCNGLKGIKTSKSLDLKVLIYFNEGDLDFVCNLICCRSFDKRCVGYGKQRLTAHLVEY